MYYAIAMGAGSVMNYIWSKKNPKSYDLYMFAIAAGLLAGEGLGGVFNALLAVIGVDGGGKSNSSNRCMMILRCSFSTWDRNRMPPKRILWLML